MNRAEELMEMVSEEFSKTIYNVEERRNKILLDIAKSLAVIADALSKANG